MQVLLVHSPLLAPFSWGDVPAAMAERGYAVAVPDLRPAMDSGPPYYERMFRAVAEVAGGDGTVAVVGHSAAGPLIPGALAAIGATNNMAVFLDARLPHEGRSWLDTLTPDRRAALLDSVSGGRLPPWDRWFPPEALADLVPDDAMRQRLHDELHGVPVELLSEPMPRSACDSRVRTAYVQLSVAYAATADQAEADGWRVARYAMGHLAPLTRGDEVAEAIADSLASVQV